MSDSRLPRGSMLNACYSIDKVLGRGGFGITYLATDTKLNLPVAVKEYLPELFAERAENYDVEPFDSKQYEFDWGLDRFLSEAQILAQFKHPNIVRVNAAFEQYGTAYMVMEYEQGVSLEQYIREDGSDLTQEFLEKSLFAIMGGLQGIHDKGFIHRDIKPANLMVRADAEQTPVLIDFGSARSTAGSDAKLTAVTSAGYSPVEQHNPDLGDQGPWTDIYALAASIRQGMTGEVPRAALDREFAARAGPEKDPLQPLAKIFTDRGFSRNFLYAVDAGLAIMPDDRPKSLADWRDLFEGVGVTNDVSSSVATEVTALPPRPDEQVTQIPVNDGLMDTALPSGGLASSGNETPPQGLRQNHDARPAPDRIADQPAEQKSASKLPLIAGAAAVVVLGGAGFVFTQLGGDKAPDDSAVTPPAVTSTDTDTDTDASGSIEPQQIVSLPKPDSPIQLVSPVERVRQQVVALNAAANPFVQSIADNGTVPDAAAEPVEMLLIKYKTLSESDIVRAFPDLKREVALGLDRLSVANSEAKDVKLTLENAVIADVGKIDESLQGWEKLDGEQRSGLIYSLASLSAEQRASLTKQAELNALVAQVNTSIKTRLEASDFQNAARIVEVALLFGGGNETLNSYRDLLELKE